jgi:hypothetical protein
VNAFPSNTDDVIDSRDVIAAIEELSELHQPGPVDITGTVDGQPCAEMAQDDLFALLAALKALAAEASDYADWEDGVTLVRDSYFEDYARELVEDCGYFVNSGQSPYSASHESIDFNAWPYRCIDWRQVATELQSDYTSVQFDGVTYWVR